MKIDQNAMEAQEDLSMDHLSAAENTPLRSDAFDLSDEAKIENIKGHVTAILNTLGLDLTDDSLKGTPNRVAKMFVNEIFRGRYYPPPCVTAFPNAKQYDQIYMSGPITINSTCAHHFQAISGKAYVGIFPGNKVIGLSKFNRMVDWVASRPQIQEEMTEQIAMDTFCLLSKVCSWYFLLKSILLIMNH